MEKGTSKKRPIKVEKSGRLVGKSSKIRQRKSKESAKTLLTNRKLRI